MIYIVTPCMRTGQLETLRNSIPADGSCEWVIVYDAAVRPRCIDGAVNIASPYAGHFGSRHLNLALDMIRWRDGDWFMALDDDNIIHPHWWKTIEPMLKTGAEYIGWSQQRAEEHRCLQACEPRKYAIDTASYMVCARLARTIRFHTGVFADYQYARDAYDASALTVLIPKRLCYYNYLRP